MPAARSAARTHLVPATRLSLLFLTVLAVVLGLTLAPAQGAPATGQDKIVSAVPGKSPAVNDGEVDSIVQVGNTMVVGGTFTSVTPVGGAATARSYVMAFDKTTGQLLPGFAPTLNGAVNDLQAGPSGTSVYLGGAFSTVNGVASSRVTQLDLSTGKVTTGFKAAALNGVVNAVVRKDNRLYVGGFFTTAGGVAHGGVAALNATTGALDPYVNNQVSVRHNDSGTGATGPVGVRDLDVTNDGSRLVAIGNFKKVDGLPRDQVVMMSLGGSSSLVTADWQTNRYTPYCFNWAFDSYVRGVSFSPDGSYFVVSATGGQNAGSLCDAAARFETSASGNDLQPTWVNYTGGDTLWGITVTEKVVYVGGHQRWLNNSLGSDYAGPGAVPRAGLAALDSSTGVPLKWNPGRNPRGAAVYALYATSDGLWMGSDTEFIGPKYNYKRPRLAFFPLAGGAPEASDATPALPGTAFIGGTPSSSQGNVVYRVNAAGPSLAAADSGPDWAADNAPTSTYRSGSTSTTTYPSGALVDSTVPSSTPAGVFDTERYATSKTAPMKWAFPATAGAPLQVRLYFANRCSCTKTTGKRYFDVTVDGVKKLDNFDIVATTGDQRGTMKAFDITSDGTVNIDFGFEINSPLVNAIEIVRRDQAAPAAGPADLRTSAVTTSGAAAATPYGATDIDWSQFRGSFVAGGKLWYGKGDGTFNSRPYSDGAFGAETKVDPYNDPDWAGVQTGSGNTFDGKPVNLYSQLSSVTGMAYAGGKLYYVKNNDGNLYWRWFNADSGIVGSDTFTANGGRDWTGTLGLFAADGKLYFVTKADGSLSSVPLTSTGPAGAPTVVNSPLTGGNDWRSRALFLVDGNATAPNKAPVASFTQSCTDLVCTFDASASSDPDGTIASYSWKFGDNSTGDGQVVQHTYTGTGSYPVELTVTDNSGGTTASTQNVAVTGPQQASPISFVDRATATANASSVALTVPATVEAGDTMVLTGALSSTTSVTGPAGWTAVSDPAPTGVLRSIVWTKTATAGDAGSTVRVTMDAVHRGSLDLGVYRGASTTQPVAVTATQDSSTSTHTTPAATVPGGSWVVSVWTEKSSATTKYTVPGNLTLRSEVYVSGSASRASIAAADPNAAQGGAVAGSTATTDTVSGKGINFTVVLAPQ